MSKVQKLERVAERLTSPKPPHCTCGSAAERPRLCHSSIEIERPGWLKAVLGVQAARHNLGRWNRRPLGESQHSEPHAQESCPLGKVELQLQRQPLTPALRSIRCGRLSRQRSSTSLEAFHGACARWPCWLLNA